MSNGFGVDASSAPAFLRFGAGWRTAFAESWGIGSINREACKPREERVILITRASYGARVRPI